MATHVEERAQFAVASPHDQNGQAGIVIGAETPRRGPVRSKTHHQRMLAKQHPLFLGEAPCVRVDRHLVAPGAVGQRRGPGLHVMQQSLQKLDLILPAHRKPPCLPWILLLHWERYGTVSIPPAVAIFNTVPYRARTQQRERSATYCPCSIFKKVRRVLFAVMAQLFQ